MKPSGVQIYARVRPSHGTISRALNVVSANVITVDPLLERRGSVGERSTSPSPGGSFRFHGVFDMNTTNEQMYLSVGRPLVAEVMRGMNGTIMAYGCSGSGKTYTMMGSSDGDGDGITPRILHDLFVVMDERKQNGWSIDVRVSFAQIYMDKVLDMLKGDSIHVDQEPSLLLRQRMDADGTEEVYIEGITNKKVNTADKALSYLIQANANRVVASTDMNTYSSRSHSIFIMRIEQTHVDGDHLVSSLYLVDLAGSEKAKKTNAEGHTLSQACYVNKSLTILSNVISALVKKKTHIPYRDSKLTRLLTHALGGNSNTLMILTCSRDEADVPETVATLKFGKRALSLPNKPKVNHVMKVEEYKLLLEKAEETLKTQKTVIEALERENASLRNTSEPTKIDNLRRQIGHLRKSLGRSEDFREIIVEDVQQPEELKYDTVSEVTSMDDISVLSVDEVFEPSQNMPAVDQPIMEEDEQKVVVSPAQRHFTPRSVAALSNEIVATLQREVRELQEENRDLRRMNPSRNVPIINSVPEVVPVATPLAASPAPAAPEEKRVEIPAAFTATPKQSYTRIILLGAGAFVAVAFLVAMIALRSRYAITWQIWLLLAGFGVGMIIAGWGLPPC